MASTAKVVPSPGADYAVSVAEAKAKLSALLNRVETKQKPVIIMRRGQPIAQLIPMPAQPKVDFVGAMLGTGRILGDIVNPYMDEWTVDEE